MQFIAVDEKKASKVSTEEDAEISEREFRRVASGKSSDIWYDASSHRFFTVKTVFHRINDSVSYIVDSVGWTTHATCVFALTQCAAQVDKIFNGFMLLDLTTEEHNSIKEADKILGSLGF